MIVKHKATGQIGEIPDNKFDPALFEKAADPRIKPSTSGMDISNPGFGGQPETQPKKGGLFSNLKDMGKAFVDTVLPASTKIAQDIGAGLAVNSKDAKAAQQSMDEAKAMNRKLVAAAAKEKDPAVKARMLKLSRESSAVLDKTNTENAPQFSEDINKNYWERGIAAGAEIAPLVMTPAATEQSLTKIPFTKSPLAKTALKRVTSMAMQGAEATGLRTFTSTKEMTPEERLTNSLVDAGWGGLLAGGIQVGGEIIKKLPGTATTVGKNISEKGAATRQGVRKIKQPAGVWGSEKEDAINSTLDSLGIKGTAEEQYKQLAPAYNKLTKDIQTYLKDKAVPVKADELAANIKSSLDDIPGDVLSETQGMKEYEKILKEVQKVKDSNNVFEMKKWMNGRLGRVYTKMEKGLPLSPAEEVLLQSRDVVDKTISTLHPEIKNLTITQSHLRDAAPSLASSRFSVPTMRGPSGFTIPAGVTQKATDLIGRGMQTIGKITETMGKKGDVGTPLFSTAQTIANKFSPALIGGFTGGEQVNNVTDNTQGNEGQVNQNQGGEAGGGKGDHISNIPKNITGYTVAQHLQALSQAQAAGDKAAVKEISAQLKIEQEFQKSLPSSKPLTAAQKLAKINADSGLRALDKMESELAKNPNAIVQASVPGSPGARIYATARKEASDVLTRLRTGAALNKEEEKFYISQLPAVFDSPETIAYKMKLFRDLFETLSNPDSLTTTLQDQVGGFAQ